MVLKKGIPIVYADVQNEKILGGKLHWRQLVKKVGIWGYDQILLLMRGGK